MTERKPTATAQLKFRVREDLRQQLEASAKVNGRTLSGEIVQRLEQSLRDDKLLSVLARIEKRLGL